MKDVDGELTQLDGHFAKCLSTDVAWQVYDPNDLVNVVDALVDSVTLDSAQQRMYLHYRRGVEVFTETTLRERLQLDGPLGPWSAARLAVDLCRSLKTLHDAEIPQGVIHPRRVGRIDGCYVLLPTAAGVLPPWPKMSVEGADWLYYAAPESLRTRNLQKELLYAADVYSLGRMMLRLCAVERPQPAVEQLAGLLKSAERRVEHPDQDEEFAFSAPFASLAKVWSRATAVGLSERPSLDQLLNESQQVAEETAPQHQFARLLKAGDLASAGEFLAEVERRRETGDASITEREWHLMSADLWMAQDPPDLGKAIIALDLAESPDVYEADTQVRRGRAYARFLANPQHLELSSNAFERAARMSAWPVDVQDEWAAVLARLPNRETAYERIQVIPHLFRSRQIKTLLVDLLMEKGFYMEAWREAALLFAEISWDESLFRRAEEIARNVEPALLEYWRRELVEVRGGRKPPEQAGFAAPLAIVCQHLGDPVEASRLQAIARSYDPQRGTKS